MEYLSGGELFSYIVQNYRLKEKEASFFLSNNKRSRRNK